MCSPFLNLSVKRSGPQPDLLDSGILDGDLIQTQDLEVNLFRPLGYAVPAELRLDPAASSTGDLLHLLGIGQKPVYAPSDGLGLDIGQKAVLEVS